MSKTTPPDKLILTKPVVLVGMMGAGKTAIGSALARRLGVSFIDSDDEIVKAANMSIAEIFERDGEAFFRKRESEILARLLESAPAVLSTGGGAFLQEQNRALIEDHGVSLWLKAELDLLWNRVKHKNTRPLLRTENPHQTLSEIFHARQDIYALSQIWVEADASYSIEQMVDQVLAALVKNGIVTRPEAA